MGVRLGCLKRTPDMAAAGLMELRRTPCGPRVLRALGGMYQRGKLPPRVLPANALLSGFELYLLGGQLNERELSKFASNWASLWLPHWESCLAWVASNVVYRIACLGYWLSVL